MGRTLQIVTPDKEELVCYVQKSAKALIMEVSRVLPRLPGGFVAVHMTGREQPPGRVLKVTGAMCRGCTLFVSVSAGCSGCRVRDAD